MTAHAAMGGSGDGPGGLPADAGAWGRCVVDLLGRQRDLYIQLDGLSAQQASLVAAEDADGLLGLLGERERVMERVLEVNARLEPYRRRWGDVVERLDEAQRAAVGALVGELEALTRRIAERDEADRRAMEESRRAIGAELGSMGRQRAAVRAYGGPARAGARYEDREG